MPLLTTLSVARAGFLENAKKAGQAESRGVLPVGRMANSLHHSLTASPGAFVIKASSSDERSDLKSDVVSPADSYSFLDDDAGSSTSLPTIRSVTTNGSYSLVEGHRPGETAECMEMEEVEDVRLVDRLLSRPRVDKTLTTAGMEVPLRGVMASECLRLLAGGEADYSRSLPVDKLDGFLSHSWRGSWWQTSIAVLLYTYFSNALLAAFVAMACYTVAWTLTDGEQTCLHHVLSEERPMCRVSYLSYIGMSAYAVAFVVQIVWPPMHSRKFFLDKGCIDQQNQFEIAKGVSSLGGFLRNCSTLLVLWSDDYFQRLWCVFELACFEHFGGHDTSKDILVIPVVLSAFVAYGNLFLVAVWTTFDTLFSASFYQWLEENYGRETACLGMAVCVATPFYYGVYWTVKEAIHLRTKLQKDIAEFKTTSSRILLDKDRERIELCIEQWYGSLEQFDAFVQVHLRERMESQIGSWLIPYWCVVAFSLPSGLRALDYVPIGCWRGLLFAGGFPFIVNPIVILIVQWSCEQRLLPSSLAGLLAWVALVLFWGLWGEMFITLPDWACFSISFVLLGIVLRIYQPSRYELRFLGFDFGEDPVPSSCTGEASILVTDNAKESAANKV